MCGIGSRLLYHIRFLDPVLFCPSVTVSERSGCIFTLAHSKGNHDLFKIFGDQNVSIVPMFVDWCTGCFPLAQNSGAKLHAGPAKQLQVEDLNRPKTYNGTNLVLYSV